MGHLGMSHFPSWLLPAPQQPGHSTFICPSPPPPLPPRMTGIRTLNFLSAPLEKMKFEWVHFLVPLKNIGKGFKFCRLLWIINPNPLIQKPRSLEHPAISQFSNYTQVEAETRKLKLVYEIKCCIKKNLSLLVDLYVGIRSTCSQITSLTQKSKCDRPTRAREPDVCVFFDFQFRPPFLAWTRFVMAFHFSSGGLPSTTNTSLTPRRVKYSNRKKRFLKCGLLTFSFRPLAHFASHIQPLKSTHNVLLLSVERFSFLPTGSSMFQRWWTPITTVSQGEWTLSEKQSWCSKLRAILVPRAAWPS